MVFGQEINRKKLNLPAISASKGKEQAMAVQLINQLTEKFNISRYKDEYTDKLLKIIKQKAKGVKPRKMKMKVVHTKTDDLMSMLKASLEKKKRAS